jgi:hypothetical protein
LARGGGNGGHAGPHLLDIKPSAHHKLSVHDKEDQALAHARMCANCDAVLVESTMLTASLRALSASYARAEATPHVEQALLAAYRQHCPSATKLITVRWRVPAALAGFAVAAGLALSIIWYSPTKHQPANEAAVSLAVPSAATSPAIRNNATQTNSTVALADAASSGGLTEDPGATTGTFMALPYSDAGPIEDATVVRVEMPGSALGSFGLPVTDGAAEGRVVADFIVGEDGTPEAIRVVR